MTSDSTQQAGPGAGAELLPCPFCGLLSAAVIQHEPASVVVNKSVSTRYEGYWMAVCDVDAGGCGGSGRQASDEPSAIAAWNRRAAPLAVDDSRERIQEIEREFVALEDLPAFIRRLQDEVRDSRERCASSDAGWLPIESAPTDGAEFLAWFPKLRLDDDGDATDEVVGGHQAIVTCQNGQWDEPQWLDAHGAYYFEDWCFADMPTLWRPLPKPPGVAAMAAASSGAQPEQQQGQGLVHPAMSTSGRTSVEGGGNAPGAEGSGQ